MNGKVIAIDQQSNFINVGCSVDVMHTLCADHHGTPHAVCYDARGNGEGGVSPTITGDHQNRITDYTAIVLLALGGTDANASVTDGTIAPCMLARAGTGGGNEPIVILERNNESIPDDNRCSVR